MPSAKPRTAGSMLANILLLSTASAALAQNSTRCCDSCTPPTVVYFSVVTAGGYCGESCLNPAHFHEYKLLEKNLTRGDAQYPCSRQLSADGETYTKYAFTDTHKLGPISAAVDFYEQTRAPDHQCCAPAGSVLCLLRKPVTIEAAGVRYCCPRGATATTPCASATGAY